MRVIAGSAKGRRIDAPKGMRVRPTPSRVREAIFAIVSERLEGSRVLDLYCGSGALGIEALSRGALAVTFVDEQVDCLRLVKTNLARLGFLEQSRLVRCRCPERIDVSLGGPFDIVLSDPPYTHRPVMELGQRLLAADLLSTGAIWIHEGPASGRKAPQIMAPPGWEQVDVRRYGDTGLWFFEPVSAFLTPGLA